MTSALEQVLDSLDIRYRAEYQGNQQIKCPVHDDSSPSCSLKLDPGLINCMACGFQGDVYNLVMTLHEMTFKQAHAWVEALTGHTKDAKPTRREVKPGEGFKPRYKRVAPARRRLGDR